MHLVITLTFNKQPMQRWISFQPEKLISANWWTKAKPEISDKIKKLHQYRETILLNKLVNKFNQKIISHNQILACKVTNPKLVAISLIKSLFKILKIVFSVAQILIIHLVISKNLILVALL